ncbi:hypothetical protein CEXT_286201 [Caerostris extrusa]|uniref:Uncharacterized protein n=1 Tax=Caerostris extrusa TaxID=172846 RepID=A0AAV4VKL3_CAEEX|nr:hypothetical protein CEXT_286201 [Caerostris extrusa]
MIKPKTASANIIPFPPRTLYFLFGERYSPVDYLTTTIIISGTSCFVRQLPPNLPFLDTCAVLDVFCCTVALISECRFHSNRRIHPLLHRLFYFCRISYR